MAVAQETGSAVAAKYLRVRVIDHSKECKPAVNVKMPMSVVRWGVKMAGAFSPEMKNVDIDWDEVNSMIQEGETGKLVEVEDEAQSKTVEVWVE
jgi:hypothetical protein